MLGTPVGAGAQPYAFVSGAAADSIGVIDLADDKLLGSFPLPGLPSGAALSFDGTRLYVVQSQLDSLVVINAGTGGTKFIPVGAGPAAVAVVPRDRRVYVANAGDDTVSAFDPVAGGVAVIPVGGAPVDLVAGGRRVYVANCNDGTISVIDWTTDTVVATVPVGTFPVGLALHHPTGRLYVANFFDDTVSVIDTRTLSVVATLPVGRRPRGLALDPAAGRLYVASFDDGEIDVVDTGSNTVMLTAASGGKNPVDLFLGPDRTRLYVAHLEAEPSVSVLAAATLAPLGVIDAPAGALAISGYGGHAPPLASSKWNPRRALGRLLQRPWRGERAAAAAALGPDEARAPADVVISDTEFNLADWTVTTAGTQTTTQESAGGDPGAWRRTTHVPGSSQVQTVHSLVRPGSQYNPASQGAIVTIDVAWSRRIVSGPAAITESFCLTQGPFQRLYCTGAVAFTSAQWQATGQFGLLEDDFAADGTSFHPDFVSGGPITFGYRRTTPFKAGVGHGLDNFRVTVRPDTGAAGRFGFLKTFEVAQESDLLTVYVRRLGGAQGEVGVGVSIEKPDGSTSIETLTWEDGQNFDLFVVPHFGRLPRGSGARTARLRLVNPTGGAAIEPSRKALTVVVTPGHWPAILQELFVRVQPLLSAFSPAWLLALAVAAVLRSRRLARSRRSTAAGLPAKLEVSPAAAAGLRGGPWNSTASSSPARASTTSRTSPSRSPRRSWSS